MIPSFAFFLLIPEQPGYEVFVFSCLFLPLVHYLPDFFFFFTAVSVSFLNGIQAYAALIPSVVDMLGVPKDTFSLSTIWEHGNILHDILIDIDDEYGLQITHENEHSFPLLSDRFNWSTIDIDAPYSICSVIPWSHLLTHNM